MRNRLIFHSLEVYRKPMAKKMCGIIRSPFGVFAGEWKYRVRWAYRVLPSSGISGDVSSYFLLYNPQLQSTHHQLVCREFPGMSPNNFRLLTSIRSRQTATPLHVSYFEILKINFAFIPNNLSIGILLISFVNPTLNAIQS